VGELMSWTPAGRPAEKKPIPHPAVEGRYPLCCGTACLELVGLE